MSSCGYEIQNVWMILVIQYVWMILVIQSVWMILVLQFVWMILGLQYVWMILVLQSVWMIRGLCRAGGGGETNPGVSTPWDFFRHLCQHYGAVQTNIQGTDQPAVLLRSLRIPAPNSAPAVCCGVLIVNFLSFSSSIREASLPGRL